MISHTHGSGPFFYSNLFSAQITHQTISWVFNGGHLYLHPGYHLHRHVTCSNYVFKFPLFTAYVASCNLMSSHMMRARSGEATTAPITAKKTSTILGPSSFRSNVRQILAVEINMKISPVWMTTALDSIKLSLNPLVEKSYSKRFQRKRTDTL